ncbi:MAG: hypothetical protein AUG74_16360 [Bacteroidetes bacterium 13_1_20CM_4_60_6]|nr:MAG: hypothetical protein AUG74_16360 [Bacteroidetes bacterium 13_1_20CM_4_60_6]
MLFFRHEIAFRGGIEAALWAKCEIFERNVLGGIVDSLCEKFGIFHARQLSADKPEHHGLALRNKEQRFESPRATVILFKEEPIDFECSK